VDVIVRHNAEIAHRLSQSPGKCQQIHGHGLQITLTLMMLRQDEKTGMVQNQLGKTLDFSEIKQHFRSYIDEGYDHHLLLNEKDEWARLHLSFSVGRPDEQLPGLKTFPGDPTVENLAKWIALWAASTFAANTIVRIDETRTNAAEARAIWKGSLQPEVTM